MARANFDYWLWRAGLAPAERLLYREGWTAREVLRRVSTVYQVERAEAAANQTQAARMNDLLGRRRK